MADGRRWRSLRPRARALAADLLVIAVAVVGSLLLVLGALRRLWPVESTYLVVTMLTAAVAAGAGVVAELVTRMTGRWSDARIAAALAVYGLVVVPTTTVAPAPDADVIALQTARLTAGVGVVALLLLALWPRGLRRRATGWPSTVVIGAVVLLVGISAVHFPVGAGAVLESVAAGWVLACYTGAGLVTVAVGLARAHRTTWRIGAGLLVLGLAQVVREAGSADVSDPYLPFAVLRLVGLSVVLAAVALRAGSLRCAERARQEAANAELAAIREEQQRGRELSDVRDHEMRNALTGLSGAARLLGMPSASVSEKDQSELRAALHDELDRLRGLLERTGTSRAEPRTRLRPLLQRLVLLHRGDGAAIDLEVADALTTPVPSPVLAQVFTNLLSNCRRHAPGAGVRISAVRLGGSIRIEVSDDGPGLAPGSERLVLQPGHGNPERGGQGLGLHVCAELLRGEGATLTMAPSTRFRPGCTAVVEVPISLPAPGMTPVRVEGSTIKRGPHGSRASLSGARPARARGPAATRRGVL